jgi:predicted RNase H-like HicB family nuclease
MYRVGYPGWKLVARLNVPMTMVVFIEHDPEAGVYFAHSDDLRGLVVEAKTLEELRKEIRAAAEELLEAEFNGHSPPTTPQLRFNDRALCAA